MSVQKNTTPTILDERDIVDFVHADSAEEILSAQTNILKQIPEALREEVSHIIKGYTKPVLIVRANAQQRVKHILQTPNIPKSDRIANTLSGLAFYVSQAQLLFEENNYNPSVLSRAFKEKFELILPLLSDGLILIDGSDSKIHELSQAIYKTNRWDMLSAKSILNRIENVVQYIHRHSSI